MPHTKTPLRYPGGKTQVAKFVAHTIRINQIAHPVYCEPFCGGAGVAIALLLAGDVDSVILNDYDSAIYSFWYAVLNDTERLMRSIYDTEINLEVWNEERHIYHELKDTAEYNFELAFATLFLNRTNRSGIITGGPIGGWQQSSAYSIGCRFNKETLVRKIQNIAKRREEIALYHLDAVDFIRDILIRQPSDKVFTFFDPPYYQQGKNLYKNSFNDEKHIALSLAIQGMNRFYWIATYDDSPRIHEIYQDMDMQYYELQYSANQKRKERELFFHSPITQVESYDKVCLERDVEFSLAV